MLNTSPNCSCSHPVQIHDRNCTHLLTSFRWSQFSDDDNLYGLTKKLDCLKWRSHKFHSNWDILALHLTFGWRPFWPELEQHKSRVYVSNDLELHILSGIAQVHCFASICYLLCCPKCSSGESTLHMIVFACLCHCLCPRAWLGDALFILFLAPTDCHNITTTHNGKQWNDAHSSDPWL